MSSPEIAILVSNYQRPRHLHRVLASLAAQRGVDGKFEVVVTDDGSTDESLDIVNQFARTADFPLRFTTHPHGGFQLARCRNEGVAASTAPYIEFLDGDCILPPDHILLQLRHRKPNTVMGADRYCLDRATSERITVDNIAAGEFVRWVSPRERFRLVVVDWKARGYNLIRHAAKPKLIGASVSVWRSDYERVNGHDKNFVGWGCEDDDFRMRIRRAGVRVESIARYTTTYHLWHPPAPSCPKQWDTGGNVSYLRRKIRLTRCLNGLVERKLTDLSMRLVGKTTQPEAAATVLAPIREQINASSTPAEIEIICLPGSGEFSNNADCKVAIVLGDAMPAKRRLRRADIVLSAQPLPDVDSERQFPLDQLRQALESVFGVEPHAPQETSRVAA